MMQRWIALALFSFVIACGSSEPSSPPRATEPATSGTETSQTEPRLVVGSDACTTDADCIPGACCHPTSCVSRDNPPTCVQSVCTSDCRYGTLDCGGSCLCHEGHCAARLSELPTIPGVQ